MSPRILKAYSLTFKTMFITGILLVPTATPHAVHDLQDLKIIIDSASATLTAASTNSSWGFFNPASPPGALGTADLVANITATILHAKYLLDVDQSSWISVLNTTNRTNLTTTITPQPTFQPSNVSLDALYVDYIGTIPTLSTALTTLGRSWHKEINKPVWDAIGALQQTISAFSSSMLSADLIHSQSVLRAIRASSSLEDAQLAWSRSLNLPGAATVRKREEDYADGHVHTGTGRRPPRMGDFYTHKELWGRYAKPYVKRSKEGFTGLYDAIDKQKEERTAVKK